MTSLTTAFSLSLESTASLTHEVSQHSLPYIDKEKPLEVEISPKEIERRDLAMRKVIVLKSKYSDFPAITFRAVELAEFLQQRIPTLLSNTEGNCWLKGSWTDEHVTNPRDIDLGICVNDPRWESRIESILAEFIQSKMDISLPEKLRNKVPVSAYFTAIPIYENGTKKISFKIYKTEGGIDLTFLFKPLRYSLGSADGTWLHCTKNIKRLSTGKTFATKLAQFDFAKYSMNHHLYIIDEPETIHNLHLRTLLDSTRKGCLINIDAAFAADRSFYKEPSAESFAKKWITHQKDHYEHDASKIIEFLNQLDRNAHNPHGASFVAHSWNMTSKAQKIAGTEVFSRMITDFPSMAPYFMAFIQGLLIINKDAYRFSYSKPVDPMNPEIIQIYPYVAINVHDQINYLALPGSQNSPVQIAQNFMNCLPTLFEFANQYEPERRKSKLAFFTGIFQHLGLDTKYLEDESGVLHILKDLHKFFGSKKADEMQRLFGPYPTAESYLKRLPTLTQDATPSPSPSKPKQESKRNSKIVQSKPPSKPLQEAAIRVSASAVKSAPASARESAPASATKKENLLLTKEPNSEEIEILKDLQECADLAAKHDIPILKENVVLMREMVISGAIKEKESKELPEKFSKLMEQSTAIIANQEIEKILQGSNYYKDLLAKLLPKIIEKVLMKPTLDLFERVYSFYFSNEKITFSLPQEQILISALIRAWKVLSPSVDHPLYTKGCDLFSHAFQKNLLAQKEMFLISFDALSNSINPVHLRKAYSLLNQMIRNNKDDDIVKRIIPLLQNTLLNKTIELYRPLFKIIVNLYTNSHSSFKLLMKEIGASIIPSILEVIPKLIEQLKYNGDEELIYAILWCILKSHPNPESIKAVFSSFDTLIKHTDEKQHSSLNHLEHQGLIARELLRLQSSVKDSKFPEWSDDSMYERWHTLAVKLQSITLKQASTYDGSKTNRFQDLGLELLTFFKKEEEREKVTSVSQEIIHASPVTFDSFESFLNYPTYSDFPPKKCAKYLQDLFTFKKGSYKNLSAEQQSEVKNIITGLLHFLKSKDTALANSLFIIVIKNNVFDTRETLQIAQELINSLLSPFSQKEFDGALALCRQLLGNPKVPFEAVATYIKLLIQSPGNPKQILEMCGNISFDPAKIKPQLDIFYSIIQKIHANPEYHSQFMIFWRIWNSFCEDCPQDNRQVIAVNQMFTDITSYIFIESQDRHLLYWAQEINARSTSHLLAPIKKLSQEILDQGILKADPRIVPFYLNKGHFLLRKDSEKEFINIFPTFIRCAFPYKENAQQIETAIKNGIDHILKNKLPTKVAFDVLEHLHKVSQDSTLPDSLLSYLEVLKKYITPIKAEDKFSSATLNQYKIKFFEKNEVLVFEECINLIRVLAKSASPADLKNIYAHGLDLLEEGLKKSNWEYPRLAELVILLRDLLLMNKLWTDEEKIRFKNCFVGLNVLIKGKPQLSQEILDKLKHEINAIPFDKKRKLIAEYEVMIQKDPKGNLEIWGKLLYLYEHFQDYKNIIRCSQEVAALAQPKEKHSAYLLQGYAYLNIGSLQDAVECYEDAYKILPRDVNTIFTLGEMYVYNGDYSKALALFKILKNDFYSSFKNPEVRYLTKVAELCEKGDFQAAVKLIQSREVNSIKELFLLGEICEKANMESQAVTYLERLNKKFDGKHTYILNVLADFYMKGLLDRKKAFEYYKKVIELNETDNIPPAETRWAHIQLGRIYSDSKNWIKSIEHFSKTIHFCNNDFNEKLVTYSSPELHFALLKFVMDKKSIFSDDPLGLNHATSNFIYHTSIELSTYLTRRPNLIPLSRSFEHFHELYLQRKKSDTVHTENFRKIIVEEFGDVALRSRVEKKWKLEIQCLTEILPILKDPKDIAINQIKTGISYLHDNDLERGVKLLYSGYVAAPSAESLQRLWGDFDDLVSMWSKRELLPLARNLLKNFLVKVKSTITLEPAVLKKIDDFLTPDKSKKG